MDCNWNMCILLPVPIAVSLTVSSSRFCLFSYNFLSRFFVFVVHMNNGYLCIDAALTQSSTHIERWLNRSHSKEMHFILSVLMRQSRPSFYLFLFILGWPICRGQFITLHFMQINRIGANAPTFLSTLNILQP